MADINENVLTAEQARKLQNDSTNRIKKRRKDLLVLILQKIREHCEECRDHDWIDYVWDRSENSEHPPFEGSDIKYVESKLEEYGYTCQNNSPKFSIVYVSRISWKED